MRHSNLHDRSFISRIGIFTLGLGIALGACASNPPPTAMEVVPDAPSRAHPVAPTAPTSLSAPTASPAAPNRPEAAAPARPQINPQMVRVTKNEPPTGCTMIGTVQPGFVFGYDAALSSIRKQAAEMGADWITLDHPAAGRAFWCPPAVVDAYDHARDPSPIAAPAAPPAPAPYTMLCEPDCSPGYACVRGACVEACNPKCVAPAHCGTDRICH